MAENMMASSSATGKVLVARRLAAAETAQYTCPASTSVQVASAQLFNNSASAVTVSVSLAGAGTAPSDARVFSFSLAAGDGTALTEVEGALLGPGDFVSAIASAANAVTLVMTGIVFS